MPTIHNHGLEIHYEIHGTGYPVLPLHGGTVSFKYNYADFGWVKSLGEVGMQVVGTDFRGHGSGQNDMVLGRGPRLASALPCGEYVEVQNADHFSLAADLGTQTRVAQFLRTRGAVGSDA